MDVTAAWPPPSHTLAEGTRNSEAGPSFRKNLRCRKPQDEKFVSRVSRVSIVSVVSGVGGKHALPRIGR